MVENVADLVVHDCPTAIACTMKRRDLFDRVDITAELFLGWEDAEVMQNVRGYADADPEVYKNAVQVHNVLGNDMGELVNALRGSGPPLDRCQFHALSYARGRVMCVRKTFQG